MNALNKSKINTLEDSLNQKDVIIEEERDKKSEKISSLTTKPASEKESVPPAMVSTSTTSKKTANVEPQVATAPTRPSSAQTTMEPKDKKSTTGDKAISASELMEKQLQLIPEIEILLCELNGTQSWTCEKAAAMRGLEHLKMRNF